MSADMLEGRFRPVKEEITATGLKVTGTLPAHLDGRYVRIGPNPYGSPDPELYHLFLGDGMTHGVRIRDGRAEWYRNRWVRTAGLSRRMGEQPRPGQPYAGMDFAVNTNVIGHAGRTFAIVEAGARPYELTEELETVGSCDFDGTLPGGYTAHPHRDPDTGELHAVSYFAGWGNKVQYSVLTADARIRRTVDIEVTGAPMMHEFSLTENYVVLYDLPVTFDPSVLTREMPRWMARPSRSVLSRVVGHMPISERLISRFMRMAPADPGLPYTWNDDYPARIGVLPRDGGSDDVRWFEVGPCYVFHPLNAYEENDTIVLDVVRHPRMFDRNPTVPHEGTSTLDRWRIDLSAGKVAEERLDDRHQEFPRPDERLAGRRHRYGYALASSGAAPHAAFAYDALLKHDLVAGGTSVHNFGPGRTPSEFVFVPNAADAGEDEGVLMGYVHNAQTDRSDMVMLDAQTLDTVATVHLPTRVPSGFHGNWLPTAG